jgi:hypothetical protein
VGGSVPYLAASSASDDDDADATDDVLYMALQVSNTKMTVDVNRLESVADAIVWASEYNMTSKIVECGCGRYGFG